MQVHRNRLIHLLTIILAISFTLMASTASAISRCGSFEIVPSPGMISHLAAINDGTLWGIGSSDIDPGTAVLRHFNGHTWDEQALPSEADGFAFGAAGSTPDGDAWFAGTRSYSVYEIEVVFMRVRGGGVDRIDTFLHPSTINLPGAPVDISAANADDVWALTASGDVIHFNGSDWTPVDVPGAFSEGNPVFYAKGIYVADPDDVWITGYDRPSRGTYLSYTQHWDGSAWTTVPTPFDGQDLTFFLDIDGSGPDDIWVAGHWNYSEDILLHWDGDAWTQAQGPASGAAMAKVMSMQPGNAWSVPYSVSQGDVFYYGNGVSWSEGTVFDLPDAVTISWHDAVKVNDCDAWAVGAYYDGMAYQPLAARLMPGEVQAEVFVNSIDVTRVRVAGKSYYSETVVMVVDADLAPIEGAIVSGDFSGPSSESLVATTGVDGTAVFSSATVTKPRGSWCFAVTDVATSAGTYNEPMNTETSDCEAEGGGGKGGGKKPR